MMFQTCPRRRRDHPAASARPLRGVGATASRRPLGAPRRRVGGRGRRYTSGTAAVEALQQVLEYFDSSAGSLKVDTISGEKLAFVVRALEAASARLDQFLSYMPPDQLAAAVAFIDYENDLNLREYAQANGGEKYLNPKPTS